MQFLIDKLLGGAQLCISVVLPDAADAAGPQATRTQWGLRRYF